MAYHLARQNVPPHQRIDTPSLSLNENGRRSAKEHFDALHTRTQHQVYDERNYKRDNAMGRICVEADGLGPCGSHCQRVQLNLMALHGVWMDTRPPVGLGSHKAYSVAGAADRSPVDWARIEAHGEDMCFLDFGRTFTSSLNWLLLIPSHDIQ